MPDDDDKLPRAPRHAFDIGEEPFPASTPEPPQADEDEAEPLDEELGPEAEPWGDDLAEEEPAPAGEAAEEELFGAEGEPHDEALSEEEPGPPAPPPIEDRFGDFRLGHEDIPLVAKNVEAREALGSMFTVLQSVAADKGAPPRTLPLLFTPFGPDYRFTETRPGVIHYAMLSVNLTAGANEIGSILDQPPHREPSALWPTGKLEALAERLRRGGLYTIVLS